MNVIVHYNGSQDAANSLANELNTIRKDSSAILQYDLLDVENMDSFIERAVAIWGRLDVLVNNASTFYPTAIEDISLSHWNDLVGVNLQAPLFLTQSCAPHLTKHKGCIVNIVDIHADCQSRFSHAD